MRKIAVIMFALMILVPGLANAWTLATRVIGPSGAGSVSIDTTPATVVTAGTKYARPSGTNDAVATITTNEGYAISRIQVNNVDQALTSPVTIAYGKAVQTIYVTFAADASKSVTVTAPDVSEGTLKVKKLLPLPESLYSNTGLTGLPSTATVSVTATPSGPSYKVDTITIGGNSYVNGTNFTLDAGVAQVQNITTDELAGSPTVSATFAFQGITTASLSAPLNAVQGTEVSVTASAVTNDAPVTYAFTVTDSASASADVTVVGNTASFTPVLEGDYIVEVVATGASGTDSAPVEAIINVINATDYTNSACLTCHSNSTPDVIADYNAGVLGPEGSFVLANTACYECHSSSPHTLGDIIAAEFTGSAHDAVDVGCAGCHDTVHSTGLANVNTCGSCHTDVMAEWETTYHANSDTTTVEGSDNAGTPYYVYYRGEGSSCQSCHFPTDQDVFDTPGTTNGNTVGGNYGAIGCVACHGDTIHSNPGFFSVIDNCGSCHDRAGHHGIPTPSQTEKVANSKHADGRGHDTSAKCQRCHTTEGSIEFAAYNGDKNVLAGLDSVTALTDVQGPTCAACHDPHTQTLRVVEGWDPNNNGEADQFDLCTSCHTYYDEEGLLVGGGSTSGDFAGTTEEFYHNTSWYRTITTTHYDNPATGVGLAINQIEGYVIRENGDNPCFDCHGHELRTNTRRSNDPVDPTDADYGPTIHTDWANSAHAGGLLKAKFAAAAGASSGNVETDEVMNAGVIDAPIGNAWAHYDWDAANRQACQHCHSATGAAAYLEAAAGNEAYVAANNDFSHLDPNQNELLYCWGCHSSVETGELRLTGAFTVDYNVNGSAKGITAPDGNSAACLTCHSGRGNLNTLLGAATLDPSGAAISSPGTKSHYLAAGLTINQAELNAGYNFGLNYADPGYFAHDSIGCAECHMTSANSHSFEVVAKDELGVITQLVSTKCVECHTGAHGAALVSEDGELGTAAAAAAFLEHEAHGYHAAMAVLADLLTTAGTPPQAGYPYFSGTAANQGHSGAMYNYSYLHHEPGAYAHNRYLAKRLLWDSIDWMDNGALDNSVPTATAANTDAAAWLGATRP